MSEPLKILCVEDDESTYYAMSKLLRMDGHVVVIATGFTEALAVAATSDHFDLLLCDIGLRDGDGDGYEVMRHVQKLHPNLRGIAVTGYGMKEDIAKAHAAGFRKHLLKPLRMNQLRQAITDVCDQ